MDSDVPEQRILEQSVRLPDGGAATGWASLRLARAAYFDGLRPDGRTTRPVPLAVGQHGHLRPSSDCVVSREPLQATEVVVRDGVPGTCVWRALYDEMRDLEDWREAVVAMDMAAAAELASISQMRGYAEEHRAWRRSSQVLRALDHASEESRSPFETRLRLVWEFDAGLPRPLVNRTLVDAAGRKVCTPDLLDPTAGLVIEYDGAEHRKAARHTRDVRRADACRRLGLEYVDVTAIDMRDIDLVVDRLLTARGRARFEPVDRRRWQVTPLVETLDQRLTTRAWLIAQQAFERGTPLR